MKTRAIRKYLALVPVIVALATPLWCLNAAAATVTDARIADVESELKARFAKADVNHDGLLTRDEAKGVMPRVYSHFDEIDTNHKGALSLNDIESFLMAKVQEQQKQAAQK